MKYQYLALALNDFLEGYITAAVRRNPGTSIRPVLVGPPAEVLQTLFDTLTASNKNDWHIPGIDRDVAVLYVQSSPSEVTFSIPPLSTICQWDYAVTARNNSQLIVMLVELEAWDSRHESLVNTTEILGGLPTEAPSQKLKTDLWTYIITQAAQATGLGISDISLAFREIAKQSRGLDSTTRDCALWEIANDLLTTPLAMKNSLNALAVPMGLPCLENTGVSVKEAFSLVQELGKLISHEGLREGIAALKKTDTARNNALQAALEMLSDYIRQNSFNGENFAQAPSWYYRPGSPIPAWWYSLNADLLKQMLDELEDSRPGKLDLQCTNALNQQDRLKDEPFIVPSIVQFQVTAPQGRSFSSPVFRGGGNINLLTSMGASETYIDTNPLRHEKALRYLVDAPGFNTGSMDVLVLDSFSCKGTATLRGARRQQPPTKSGGIWKQQMILPRGGPVELNVYHSSQVAEIVVQVGSIPESPSTPFQPSSSERKPTSPSGPPIVPFVITIEHGDQAVIALKDDKGAEFGKWVIEFEVEISLDTVQSYFEAYINAHQGKTRGRIALPKPPDYPLQRLELEYLASQDSWKPVLACWANSVENSPKPDWSQAFPCIGDTMPDVDPRRQITPSQEILQAREVLRGHLADGKRTFGQIDLGEERIVRAAEQYLRLYLEWLSSEPEQATWFDCISIHDAYRNREANRYSAKSEPTAMMLSPLHPLRIAWHSLAQQKLHETSVLCPAAGLLNPHSCPDVGTWYTPEGAAKDVPRVFFSLASEDPHWAVLLNKDVLEPDLEERKRVLLRLSELGLRVKGVAGGFSISQTRNSLEEVTRLLPARATLRIGVVGRSETSSSCARGVIEWCQDRYAREEDEESPRNRIPFSTELYDMREGATYPSPEQLATLSENTQERVNWFNSGNSKPGLQLDLVILDQLGAESPKSWDSKTRSPMGYGALHRVRVREDFQDAAWLDESRIGTSGPCTLDLAGLLQKTCQVFEEYATRGGVSQFRFAPNRQAIGSQLASSTFLAVTSTQIDPAGIIRGTKDQDAYLWDYMLPDALGGDEDSAGYYLIAEPLPAMKNALKKAVEVITSSRPSDEKVRELLGEISRRGIPILKRLASGGSQSRGELGMLLAVRLLQDAFRMGPSGAKLPVWDGECLHLLLPADPYQKPFERIRRALQMPGTDQRPDLLVIAIHAPSSPTDSPVQLKITPVEVKFRSGQMSEEGLKDALGQATNLGKMLNTIWTLDAPTQLWDVCGTALLAQCLNLAFRIYADESIHGKTSGEWTRMHERVLRDVLSKQAIIEVNEAGRLLVFDESLYTSIRDIDSDGQYDSIVLSREDARVLLTGIGNLSPDAEASVHRLKFSHSECSGQKAASSTNERQIQLPSPSVTTTSDNLSRRDPGNGNFSVVNGEQELHEIVGESNTDLPVNSILNVVPSSTEETLQEVQRGVSPNIEPSLATPRAFVGWIEPSSRWTLVGKLDTTGEFVALDLDHPKAIGIFGYMGSGKSYLVGDLIESALAPIPNINVLPSPLSVVIFNYRRNVSDRFEMSSLMEPNRYKTEVERLATEYSAIPQALQDAHVLCLPGELDERRKEEYGKLTATELFFDPSTLSVQDWELLMGDPESDALFARTIRHVLGELRSGITLERLQENVLSMLSGQSRRAAEDRFRFLQKYISPARGVKFDQILKPGRAVIIDLRKSLFSRKDALRFFLVCADHVSRVQRNFNKIIIFDEAHEYLSDEFGETIAARIRLMRHEGTSYVFATQDVESIPPTIRRFITSKFVFSLGTRQNIDDLLRFAPEFKNQHLQGIRPGYCLIQTDQSTGNMFERPRLVSIRPRVTQHGGVTQIFSTDVNARESL